MVTYDRSQALGELVDFLLAHYDETESAIDQGRDETGADRTESDQWGWVVAEQANLEAKRQLVTWISAFQDDLAREGLRIMAQPYANREDFQPRWAE